MQIAVTGKVLTRSTGGNTAYARPLYEEMREQGVCVRVMTPPGDRLLDGRLRGLGYAAAEGVWWPGSGHPRDADVMHYPADTGPLRRGTVPQVVTVHGSAMLHLEGLRSGADQWLWKTRVARAARVCEAVVTISDQAYRDVLTLTGIPESKVTVIRHGIDHTRFFPEKSELDAKILAPLALPDQFLCYLGNLEPKKNLINLVRAMDHRQVRKLGVPLVVAGRPTWNSSEILREIRASPHVRYVGPVAHEQVAPLLRSSTAFVFPSLYEGWGAPPLEAMACGTPTITSRRGALPETTGGASLSLHEISSEGIAAGISRMLRDSGLQRDLRQAGLTHAAEYSWSESARRHIALFRKVSGL